MAKQICILGYVITIILILSNIRNVYTNKNNQYVTTTSKITSTTYTVDGTDNLATISSTQQTNMNMDTDLYAVPSMATMRSTEIKPINVLHDNNDFMQRTLHNQHSTIVEEPNQYNDQIIVNTQVERKNDAHRQNEKSQRQQQQHLVERQYIVQQDTENSKQLLSTLSIHETHNTDTIFEHTTSSSASAFTHHNKFMNETKTVHTTAIVDSNTNNNNNNNHTIVSSVQLSSDAIKNAQSNKHNQATMRVNVNNDDDDDARKSDEITSMPMKIIRDNVNATSDMVNKTLTLTSNSNSSRNVQINPIPSNDDNVFSETEIDATFQQQQQQHQFEERSRYLETDLDFNDELSDEAVDSSINDKITWPNEDRNKFDELNLNDSDENENENENDENWSIDSPIVESREQITSTSKIPAQNILKISKPNKSKSMKRLTVAQPPLSPQALQEIRLNKSPTMLNSNGKQFINSNSFRYITDLYDQYEWDVDSFRSNLGTKCASDMDVYLYALNSGKTWAARGKYKKKKQISIPFEQNE